MSKRKPNKWIPAIVVAIAVWALAFPALPAQEQIEITNFNLSVISSDGAN